MITATEIKVYDLSIGDKSFGLYQVVSQWEQLLKLVGIKTGYVIIAMPKHLDNGMSNCFDGMFARISGIPLTKDLHIIAASPDLALAFKNVMQKDLEGVLGK